MLIILPSGTFSCAKMACGYQFWGVHGHDSIWHLAIANVSFNTFPFQAPTYAGADLSGYNYLLDLAIFLLSKSGLSSLFVYFKLLPIMWFVLFTGFLIALGRKIKESPLFVTIFLFISYFAGSFSYILTIMHDGTLKGSSTLLPLHSMHSMSNLPYAFSLLIFLAILMLVKDKKVSVGKIVLMAVLIFFNLGMKFYAGAVSSFLIGIYLITIFSEIGIKKFLTYTLIVVSGAFFGILLFYDPFNSFKTGSIFAFVPLALIHPITEDPGMFYLQNMTDARYFLNTVGIGPRLIGIEILNIFLFFFFYLGIRFFGFIYIIYLFFKRKLTKFDIILIFTTIFSFTLTATLVQKAEWWNTIQFFFYGLFILTIYISRGVEELITKKHIISVFIALCLLLSSLPASFDVVRLFASFPGAAYVSKTEMGALEFLKNQPDGIVLAPLYNKLWKKFDVTNPLYQYEDTSYISAFSHKPVYLADILQLRLTGVNYEKRLKRLRKFDCGILHEVKYIYEIRHIEGEGRFVACDPKKIKKIFNSDEVFIYSIIK